MPNSPPSSQTSARTDRTTVMRTTRGCSRRPVPLSTVLFEVSFQGTTPSTSHPGLAPLPEEVGSPAAEQFGASGVRTEANGGSEQYPAGVLGTPRRNPNPVRVARFSREPALPTKVERGSP